MMEAMTVGSITIHSEVFTGGVVLAVMVAAYWFRSVYKRYQALPRSGDDALSQGIRRRRRLRYTKAEQDAIREKARRRL